MGAILLNLLRELRLKDKNNDLDNNFVLQSNKTATFCYVGIFFNVCVKMIFGSFLIKNNRSQKLRQGPLLLGLKMQCTYF